MTKELSSFVNSAKKIIEDKMAKMNLSEKERAEVRKAVPWVFQGDVSKPNDPAFQYFAPGFVFDELGRYHAAFLPTDALKRLQLEQSLALGTGMRGDVESSHLEFHRYAPYIAPSTPEESIDWFARFSTKSANDLIVNEHGYPPGLEGMEAEVITAIYMCHCWQGRHHFGNCQKPTLINGRICSHVRGP